MACACSTPISSLRRSTGAPSSCSVDRDGLHIVEALETQGSDRGPVGKVVKLARWKDKECTTLAPQKPVATDVIVLLGNPQQDDDEKQS